MPLKVLSKLRSWRKGGPVLEPIEMGAVQEEEKVVPVQPGQPVPYEADSWAPPRWNGGDSTPLYQRGSAHLEPREGAIDPYKPRPRTEKAHEVHRPEPLEEPEEPEPIGYQDAKGSIWLETPPGMDLDRPVEMGMDHECLTCGHVFRVPRRRPIEVACPECGVKDLLR